MKKLRTLLTLLMVGVCSWQSAWADDVVADVTLKETNSLNTEILALSGINSVAVVTHLTVTTESGVQLGDQDWTTLKSMTALQVLDLSNASTSEIPKSQFSGSNCPNLVTVKLPKGLTTIGSSAFYGKDNLITVEVPNTVTAIGSSAFHGCDNLESCDLSQCNITAIPDGCFSYCRKLRSFEIPSTVTDIGSDAFRYCNNFTSPLPTVLKRLGSCAFFDAYMNGIDVVLPEGAEIGGSVFDYSHISSIEFPSTYYRELAAYDNCSNLHEVTMKSPTVVNHNSYSVTSIAGNVTLKVPSHLVALYKSDPKWSKYKDIVAISPAVTDYTVSTDLNLSNSSIRMEGTPNVFFKKEASLIISGSTAQAFNNYTANASFRNYSYSGNRYSMILNELADVTVNGFFKQRIYLEQGEKDWYFLCMPFDFMVGDVTAGSGSFVIRTYDGTRRNTENTNSGNWSANLASDVEIKAGTGFILQASKETYITFKAKAGGTNYAFKKKSDVLQIPLASNNSNTSASAANTGWNMVGNPWQTYYNIHNMNYTAPFAVRGSSSYTTYSPDDDDVALAPFQAIFVQCPSGVEVIEFPANGRQMTNEVTSANPANTRAMQGRQLFDIQIASGELKDKTRLVVNDNALMDYEIGRDASKLFVEDSPAAQIYSLGADGTQYAINERPADKGTLKLGVLFAADGEHTFSAIRNEVGQVILIDHETGIKTDLQQNSYSFSAMAGTCDARFSLSFGSIGGNGDTTGINTLTGNDAVEKEVYTLDGVKVGNSTIGLQKGIYVVRQGQKTQKVIIK